ncbi:PspC domain-containing protein [Undibacterium jejuense]|uniref:PspC domain-containing protein n=1 Tax=Undibacterium jejuense TaxID=1344949 RepID=A0A923KN34_9BURK|nr:PspC domain-containing protein [Undibacterium jejuense]
MNIADEIQRLHELHQSGALSDAEFAQAKAKLLEKVGSGTSSNQSESSFKSASFSGADDALNQLNRFRRSTSDKWLGGICGGLGKFTGLDSWIWRLIFVFFAMFVGSGVLAYLLAWIFVPEEE